MSQSIDPSSLREALRFLWFARETKIGSNGEIDLVNVIRSCRDKAGISSFSPNPLLGIRFLVDIGLAEEADGTVRLTKQGIVVAENAQEPITLNSVQRDYILENLVTDKVWSRRIRSVLTKIRADESGTLVFTKSLTELAEEEETTLTLLQLMKVMEFTGESLVLKKDTANFLAGYMQSWLPISQTELDAIIEERKRMALMAEDYILEWERKRLEHLGFPELRSLVSRVSDRDVSRGYDIHSVDGENGSDRDRYIEVKSSIGGTLTFYWTSREIEVATLLRDQYWIYFVPSARSLPEKCTVLAIQDPIRFKDSLLELSLANALVRGGQLFRIVHVQCDFGSGYRGIAWKLDAGEDERDGPIRLSGKKGEEQGR